MEVEVEAEAVKAARKGKKRRLEGGREVNEKRFYDRGDNGTNRGAGGFIT